MAGFCPRFFVGEVGAGRFPEEEAWPAALGDSSLSDSSPDLTGQEFALSRTDAHHALRVLRLRRGDMCEVVVGSAVYAATLQPGGDTVKVSLVRRLEELAAGPRYRHQVGIVQAVVKPSLIDQVIEKGTEVGASFFLLAPSAGSTRWEHVMKEERLTRWRRIAQEAAKQSKRLTVPVVGFSSSLDEAFHNLRHAGVLSVVLQPDAVCGLRELLEEQAVSPARIALWVGPEGGWSPGEVKDFASRGMKPARLGRSVLRTETAGPVAVAVTRLVLGDW